MKTNKLRIVLTIFTLCICCFFGSPLLVYGADGTLSIAVSDTKVAVGGTLTVTLQAQGANGEAATADMVFTYDTSVFSFVNCEGYYTGGEGGTVNASGGSVNITLKAISSGSGSLKVSGSNGKLKDSQEALSAMAAAGVRIEASGEADSESNANQSSDNSLSSITLSQGELSPAFSYNVTEYKATVPYEVTDLEVEAKTSHQKAEVEDIIGNHQMEVGENRVAITVKAENGARVVYNILVTRQAQGESSGEGAGEPGAAGTDPSGEQPAGDNVNGGDATDAQGPASGSEGASSEQLSPEEYEGRIATLQESILQLEEKYKEQKAFSRKAILILAAVTVLLLIVCVNLLLFRRRKQNDDFDWSDDEFEEEPEEQEQKQPRFGFGKNKRRKQKEEDELWTDEEELMEDPFATKAAKDKKPLSAKDKKEEPASNAGTGQNMQQTLGVKAGQSPQPSIGAGVKPGQGPQQLTGANGRMDQALQQPASVGVRAGQSPQPSIGAGVKAGQSSQQPSAFTAGRTSQQRTGLGAGPSAPRGSGLGNSQMPQRVPGAATGRIGQPVPGSEHGQGKGTSLRSEQKAREEIEFIDLDDL